MSQTMKELRLVEVGDLLAVTVLRRTRFVEIEDVDAADGAVILHGRLSDHAPIILRGDPSEQVEVATLEGSFEACEACGGGGTVARPHPAWGSLGCPEPYIEVTCGSCYGTGRQ